MKPVRTFDRIMPMRSSPRQRRSCFNRIRWPSHDIKRAVSATLGALFALFAIQEAHANHGEIILRSNPFAGVITPIGTGGPAYRFNPELSTFEPSKGKLGSMHAHNAPTLGKQRIYVGSTYTHLSFDSIEGNEIPTFTLGLLDLMGEYGVADNWQLGVSLPLVYVDCTDCDEDGAGASSDINGEFGIGDLRVRTKYRFFEARGWIPDLAALAEVSAPTGNEDEFRGSGLVHVTAMLIASRTYGEWFTPHVNFAVQLAIGDAHAKASDQHNMRWLVGTDVHIYSGFLLSFDVIARHKLDAATDPTLDTVVGENTYDLGLGLKANPWDDLNLTFATQIPLNDGSGLRTKATLRFGIEYAF